MVIPFPAAAAAPQPIGTLLDRCAVFLEDTPRNRPGIQQLLQQLREVRPGMLLLPAPDTSPTHISARGDCAITWHANREEAAFFVRRHDDGCNGRYTWSARRYDDTGRIWRTSGHAVIDDFGNLVEVPA
ncbi:hypothetical protein [Variovorax sp. 3P27G3]|jgi:hypothetical protein|uniref:hypothetical protein n=1 Tax=Variovorax sp. 3P27G3 TaxID=2502214 RepID=UPI0010F54C5E|nr:hypothetical protein [Variovorax sp. 3P27G3]